MTNNDPKIKVRSAKFGQDKKGGETVALYIGQDQIENLIGALTELTGNERGVALRAHIYESTTKDGSRTYQSGSLFVSPVQEFSGDKQTQAPKRFVKAGAPATTTTPVRPANGYNGNGRVAKY